MLVTNQEEITYLTPEEGETLHIQPDTSYILGTPTVEEVVIELPDEKSFLERVFQDMLYIIGIAVISIVLILIFIRVISRR